MKAARFHAHHDVRVENVSPPKPKDNEVLVAIEWCGICGSDLHEYVHGPLLIPPTDKPHPLTKSTLPVIMGHEFCGRVLEIPAECKTNFTKGDAVMVDPRLYCSSCLACKDDATNACFCFGFLGLSGGGGGGLSEVVAVDANACYIVREEMLPYAALIEPLCVSWHAASQLGTDTFENLDSILIIGGGPIELTLGLVLRARGARKIYITEPTTTRRAQAAEVADRVLNPAEENVRNVIRLLTGGGGVDVVFDCAGIQPGAEDGMNAIARCGTYINIAGWGGPFTIPLRNFMFKEVIMKGSMSYTEHDFKQTVEAFNNGTFSR